MESEMEKVFVTHKQTAERGKAQENPPIVLCFLAGPV